MLSDLLPLDCVVLFAVPKSCSTKLCIRTENSLGICFFCGLLPGVVDIGVVGD